MASHASKISQLNLFTLSMTEERENTRLNQRPKKILMTELPAATASCNNCSCFPGRFMSLLSNCSCSISMPEVKSKPKAFVINTGKSWQLGKHGFGSALQDFPTETVYKTVMTF